MEIFKALYGYTSDKLNIPVSDLNKDHIADKLKAGNVSDTTIQQLISALDNCEYARYAPSTVSGDFPAIALGTGMMCFYVLTFNHLIWRPLFRLAEARFNFN